MDDNAADSRLLRDALSGLTYVTFEHAFTFEGAVKVLRSQNSDRRINLIILDWYLHPIDGIEMLSVLKSDEALRPIPVIVLAGSANPSIVRVAYDAHASCVLIKPLDSEGVLSLAAEIDRFWLWIVQLPFSPGSAHLNPE
ncbi:MAG TPA: response regulator [Edaphobacter sp.]|nr:response regulator [Edaphobacter sp.]